MHAAQQRCNQSSHFWRAARESKRWCKEPPSEADQSTIIPFQMENMTKIWQNSDGWKRTRLSRFFALRLVLTGTLCLNVLRNCKVSFTHAAPLRVYQLHLHPPSTYTQVHASPDDSTQNLSSIPVQCFRRRCLMMCQNTHRLYSATRPIKQQHSHACWPEGVGQQKAARAALHHQPALQARPLP